MADAVIHVENLSKRYHIGVRHQYDTLRDKIMAVAASPIRSLRSFGRSSSREEDIIWALKDVSFDVKAGEVVGIIGRNGSGKSTLLKILSRITEPTNGRAEIRGRVGSLLEVGTGFHPELTGRENILLSGAILGMSRREINAQLDEIIDFSGVEKFIDTPVKRYSSGMHVRLGFAIAAHLQPEILLVDEVLAVGDAEFQKKCLGKMGDVAKEGRTILFVSHNVAAIENLCHRVCLIEAGRLVQVGPAKEVITQYLSGILSKVAHAEALRTVANRSGSGRLRLTGFHMETPGGAALDAVRSGMDVVFAFEYECPPSERPRRVDIGFSIHTPDRATLCILYTSCVNQVFDTVPSRGEFRCLVPRLPLAPGRYLVGAQVTAGGEEADWPRDGVGTIDIEAGDFFGTGHRGFPSAAPVLVTGDWSIVEK